MLDFSAVANCAPSDDQAVLVASPARPPRSLTAVPFARSQTLHGLSRGGQGLLAVGLDGQRDHAGRCPDSVFSGPEAGRSQIRTELSSPPEPDAGRRENRPRSRTSLVWPSNVLSSFLVAESQSRTVLSNPAVANVLPSGLKATA